MLVQMTDEAYKSYKALGENHCVDKYQYVPPSSRYNKGG